MSRSASALISSTIKSYIASFSGLSASCWNGITMNFVNTTLMGACYFLTIYFVNELNLSVTTAGIIMSCYGIGTIFGGYFGGNFSDKTSPHFVSIISLVLSAIGFFSLIVLTSPIMLGLTLFLIGVGCYGFITSNHLWILERTTESERLKALNILAVASNLGLGLSAMLIGLISNFNLIFSFSGVMLSLSAIYLCFNNGNRLENNHLDAQTKSSEIKTIKKNNLVLCLVLFCLFLVGFVIAQTGSTYPIYIQEKFPEFGVQGVSLLFMLNTFMVVALQAPIVHLFRKQNKLLLVGIGAFLLGNSMVILNFSTFFSLAAFACVIETIGEMLFFSVAQLVCYEKGEEKKKGQSLGLYRMVYASSRVVGPATGGVIFQQLGGNMLWYFCGLFGVISFMSCFYFRRYD